jgi:hypothetical protein
MIELRQQSGRLDTFILRHLNSTHPRPIGAALLDSIRLRVSRLHASRRAAMRAFRRWRLRQRLLGIIARNGELDLGGMEQNFER